MSPNGSFITSTTPTSGTMSVLSSSVNSIMWPAESDGLKTCISQNLESKVKWLHSASAQALKTSPSQEDATLSNVISQLIFIFLRLNPWVLRGPCLSHHCYKQVLCSRVDFPGCQTWWIYMLTCGSMWLVCRLHADYIRGSGLHAIPLYTLWLWL